MRMTKMMWFALALMVSAQTVMTSNARAQVLTGDARLACEAMKAQLWFNPLALYHFLKLCPKK
jgi:hypothetical protein